MGGFSNANLQCCFVVMCILAQLVTHRRHRRVPCERKQNLLSTAQHANNDKFKLSGGQQTFRMCHFFRCSDVYARSTRIGYLHTRLIDLRATMESLFSTYLGTSKKCEGREESVGARSTNSIFPRKAGSLILIVFEILLQIVDLLVGNHKFIFRRKSN